MASGFWERWFGTAKAEGPPSGDRIPDESEQAFFEGRFGDAERLLVTALGEVEAQDPDGRLVARILGRLADVYRVQAKYVEAEPLYRRAVEIEERRFGNDHPGLARNLQGLSLIYRAQGLYGEAEPLGRRALRIVEGSRGAQHAAVAPYVANLLALCLAQGHRDEAETLFRRTVELKERLLGPAHPDLAGTLDNYAAFLRKTHGDAVAAPVEARARALRATAMESVAAPLGGATATA